MAVDKDTLLAQIDDVLARCGASPESPFPKMRPPTNLMIPDQVAGNAAAQSAACVAVISRVAPGTSYEQNAHDIASKGLSRTPTVVELVGVLAALRADVDAGYTYQLTELVHANVFADYLDMADEFLNKGFKDPAAVVAGSTLEEHLRKLIEKHGREIAKDDGQPKKADSLNAELAGIDVYNKLVLKQVTSWLDLRNKAAHGHHNEYDKNHVAGMIRDIRDFIGRLPA